MADLRILKTATVGAAGARAAIDAAEAEARAIGLAMTIVVVDWGGDVLAVHRMDGARRVGVETATAKARTVILTGGASLALQGHLEAGHLMVMAIPGTVPLGGGVPILLDGAVIGAVAASGDSVENDVRVAEAGARAIFAPL